MIVWMLYCAAIALLVAADACAADWLARYVGYRVRWIWAGALALTVYLSISAALPGAAPVVVSSAATSRPRVSESPQPPDALSWPDGLVGSIARLRRSFDASLRTGVTNMDHIVSRSANIMTASIASLCSAALALILVGVGRRFRKARRDWPIIEIHGVNARLAQRIGPLVIGVVRPEIVVPRWLLARGVDEQRLVVAHEHEHVRARDPLLLGLGWGAVVAAPWNPALWYMLSRLRLAIELDCDARVLGRGAERESYGAFLIDVAEQASTLGLSALALVGDPSHLHQRILAMTPTVPRLARLRAIVAAAFVLAGALVACQATLPPRAEVERAVVATREPAGSGLTKPVPAAVAPRQVNRPRLRRPARVAVDAPSVTTIPAVSDSIHVQPAPLTQDGAAGQLENASGRTASAGARGMPLSPLIFIDGVRATEDDIRSLDRLRIETVEVLKGAAAARYIGDPDAANGVIIITTKRD